MNFCVRNSVASRRISEDTGEELPAPFGCNALTAPFSQVIYKPSLKFDINDLLSADGELLFFALI